MGVSEIPQEETGDRRYLKWVWLFVYVGVVISCDHCSAGVATPPEGKELGENDEPNNDARFSPNMDSDYHSLSNAPMLSPGKASIYGVVMWSIIIGGSSRGFSVLKEETEESEDDDQDNELNPVSDLNCDQGSDQSDDTVSPNFESPTFNLSYDQGCQDVESQQNIDQDQTRSKDYEDIAAEDSPDLSPVIVPPQPHDFRNIRRTMSGALEVYGAVGVSVVARSSPHMQRRHSPNVPNQECMSVCLSVCMSVIVCVFCMCFCVCVYMCVCTVLEISQKIC